MSKSESAGVIALLFGIFGSLQHNELSQLLSYGCGFAWFMIAITREFKQKNNP